MNMLVSIQFVHRGITSFCLRKSPGWEFYPLVSTGTVFSKTIVFCAFQLHTFPDRNIIVDEKYLKSYKKVNVSQINDNNGGGVKSNAQ
jgi:hypothetical protein